MGTFEEFYKTALKFWPVSGLLLIQGTGFVFWNSYLLGFGFFEYNLIQTRFLSTGLFFWLPLLAAYFLTEFLLRLCKDCFHNRAATFWSFLFCWLVIFVYLFPNVYQSFGGAAPFPTSLIGSPDQIRFLENLDINPVKNADGKGSIQTNPVCLIYQNDQYILFSNAKIPTQTNETRVPFRVISISRDQVLGFQQPSPSDHSDLQCELSKKLVNFEVSH